jgi:hypothetical protein
MDVLWPWNQPVLYPFSFGPVDPSNVNATSPFGFLSLLSPLLADVAGSVLVYNWPWPW